MNGLDARTMRVVGSLGTPRAVGVFKSLKAQGVSVLYPGIVKRLKTLCSQGLLSKDGFGYSVNAAWISEMKDFFAQLA